MSNRTAAIVAMLALCCSGGAIGAAIVAGINGSHAASIVLSLWSLAMTAIAYSLARRL